MTTTTPTWLPVIVENFPTDLTSLRAWYPALIRPKRGKVGQWDKIPADPETAAPAKWSDPSTRCTFSDAYMAYQRDPRFHGIGFMMHVESGLIGIDLDKSVSPDGSIAPWALEIVHRFDGAYWERSVSGTGLRGFCRGALPVGGCRSKIEGCSVELYADERFLVVTGQVVRP
jgi:putative DNA primase/helicase